MTLNGTARALQGFVQRRRFAPPGGWQNRHRRSPLRGIRLAGGRLISPAWSIRSPPFVFMIDDRFYGTITAYVPGAQAAQYEFTSGLPVRLLGALMPTLAPLLDRVPQDTTAGAVGAR